MVRVDALWSGGRGSFPGELDIFTVSSCPSLYFLEDGVVVTVDALWSGGRCSFPGELDIFTVCSCPSLYFLEDAMGF